MRIRRGTEDVSRCLSPWKSKRLSPCQCLQIVITLSAPLLAAQTVTEDSWDWNTPSNLAVHPRISKNCIKSFHGSEGLPIQAFQLQKVFVIITSGLRAPSYYADKSHLFSQDSPLNSCHFGEFAKLHKSEKVRNYPETLFVKEKVKHKAVKSGFKVFSHVPESVNCQSHSLTVYGVLQSISLGDHLRKSYLKKLKSLDKPLLPPGLAETFGEEALYQSLNGVLYGLLTEKQFVYTDIAKASSNYCPSSLGKDALCKTDNDLHFYVSHSFDRESILFKTSKLTASRGNGLIQSTLNSISAKNVISHLSSQLCFESPSKTEKIAGKLSWQDVDHVFNVSDEHIKYLLTSLIFKSYSVARTFGLRQLLKQWMIMSHKQEKNCDPSNRSNCDNVINNDFKVISVDDLFLLSILSAMNVPGSEHITPSSRFVIEMFTPETASPVPENEEHQIINSLVSSGQNYISNISPENKNFLLQNEEINNAGKVALPQEHIGIPKSTVLLNILSTSSSNRHENPTLSLKHKLMKSNPRWEKQNNIPAMGSHNQNNPYYVRLLFNGQIVTSHVPGCERESVIKLGLCSLETFWKIIDLKEVQGRDEL